MKTGNTALEQAGLVARTRRTPQWSPVMKTGNTWKKYTPPMPTTCLNGARS